MAKHHLIIAYIAIALLAGITRFWQLTTIPSSLTMDEVSIGYASYSILTRGTDEWNISYPLSFKSVEDYKPPVNIYINAISIAIFGLTEFAVRAPVALLGTLTIPLFMWLLHQLKLRPMIIYASGTWLALLPWHIHFSRFGLEAITSLFFFLLGLNAYLKALHSQKPIWLSLCTLGFSLSVWAYHSARLFVPLTVLVLIITNWKLLLPIYKKSSSYLSILILLLFALPFLYLAITSPVIARRAQQTSLIGQVDIDAKLKDFQEEPILSRTYHSLKLITTTWARKYLEYFEPRFLFWKGISWTSKDVPGVGLLFLADIIPIAAGTYALFIRKKDFISKLTIALILLGPLPASLTINDQHPLRAITWIPAFGLLFALGIKQLLSIKYKHIILSSYAIVLILNILYAYDIYTLHFSKFQSEFYGYGFKQAAQYACQHQDQYDNIIFSPIYGSQGPEYTGLPGYYVLFYCQVDPNIYVPDRKIPKYDFRKADWREAQEMPGRTLVIASKWDFPNITPPPAHIIQQIDYPSGKPAFFIVDTQVVHPELAQ